MVRACASSMLLHMERAWIHAAASSQAWALEYQLVLLHASTGASAWYTMHSCAPPACLAPNLRGLWKQSKCWSFSMQHGLNEPMQAAG